MLAFPLIFLILAVALIYFGVSDDIFGVEDMRIYVGIAVVTAGAYIILYLITYKLKYFNRR